jgi:hypothetical protein
VALIIVSNKKGAPILQSKMGAPLKVLIIYYIIYADGEVYDNVVCDALDDYNPHSKS